MRLGKGSLSRDWLSHSLFTRLISLSSRLITPTGVVEQFLVTGSQVTLAQSESQSEKRVSFDDGRHTLRSSGARELGSSASTDIALLWSEKQVLLAERIIPTGIMARS